MSKFPPERILSLFFPSIFIQKTRGLSVIELLIATGVIVIIISIVVSGLKGFQPDIQLNASARDLITDLRYTQQITITEQLKYCLKFFSSERKYQITECGGTAPLKEVILSEGIRAITVSGFTSDTVEFNPYGAVKETGEIRLENTKGKIKIIEVKPSGFVKTTN